MPRAGSFSLPRISLSALELSENLYACRGIVKLLVKFNVQMREQSAPRPGNCLIVLKHNEYNFFYVTVLR
jgi:hypothetical protein